LLDEFIEDLRVFRGETLEGVFFINGVRRTAD
jgi:hypothetical protein